MLTWSELPLARNRCPSTVTYSPRVLDEGRRKKEYTVSHVRTLALSNPQIPKPTPVNQKVSPYLQLSSITTPQQSPCTPKSSRAAHELTTIYKLHQDLRISQTTLAAPTQPSPTRVHQPALNSDAALPAPHQLVSICVY